VACDLNFIVKGEGLLKVTGSHVHWRSGYRLFWKRCSIEML